MTHVEGESSFGVGDLGARDGRLITSCLQPALALVATFEEISDTDIELLGFVQILSRKILRAEKGYELGVGSESRIGAEICGDLLRLVLKNLSSGSFERMVVGESEIDGLIEGDQRWRCVLGGRGRRTLLRNLSYACAD